MYAEVLLSKVSQKLDRLYTYEIPKELEAKVKIGSQVAVPFGRREDVGYIVGFADKSDIKGIRNILSLTSSEPLFTEQQVKLARWLADYYCSFFISALKLMMPPGIRRTELRRSAAKPVIRDTSDDTGIGPITEFPAPIPTQEQKLAIDAIISAMDGDRPEKFLLYGITGSGKTEVYLQSIGHLLKKGKTAIVLVPEISLTPQLIQRFRERFRDHIATLHSDMTLKQRAQEWWRINAGEASIVIGTRSALFAPVKNLGLIVIDEEYETTYKQEKSPRYHAREAAFFLAEQFNAPVVMGSATPSVETFYRAEAGEIKKLVLSTRIDDRPLPPVTVVDMRDGKEHLLSQRLRDELKATLTRGEQAILFINRRGYFTFVICKSCGYTVSCPRCSISLTYHTGDRLLHCGRCGYKAEASAICPRCNKTSINYFGSGTQRIEKEVADIHPSARILRYDRDALEGSGAHAALFAAFADGKADVLIGTQMVAKGMDIAKVTLVGVVAAETALRLPDFRAAERTFQLLTQVAGRAGRHHLPGKVIIQSYEPDHYAIQAAAQHDYEKFYRQEIEHRRELGYPPFSRLVSLLFHGAEEEKVGKSAEEAAQFLRRRMTEGVLGPAQATIPKIRGEWRFRILLKGERLDQIRQAVRETMDKLVIPFGVRADVDIEPMNML